MYPLAIMLLPVLALCALSWSASGAGPDAPADSVTKANNRFALDLYAQLCKEQPGKNLFFSPASISVALAMTGAGARGATAAEMARVLQLGNFGPETHAQFHQLLDQWNSAPADRGYQLRVANRLWGQQGFAFLDSFLTVTRQQYAAELGIVDFAQQTEAARHQINTWIEQQTADKIRDLIPAGVLDGLTRLVLTNAIYFKGDWADPFKPDQTHDAPFAVSATQHTTVALMHQQHSYGYAEDDRLQVLELPYVGKHLTLLVLLPRAVDGLGDMENSLSVEKIQALAAQLHYREVNVYLPKFKLEASFSLNATLQALGMPLAFSRAADFSGMDGHTDLFLSAVLHKAFVEVNEQGTEAAAATGAIMGLRALPPSAIPVFRADHPFVFAIRDQRDGSLLFVGRMVNPPTAGQ